MRSSTLLVVTAVTLLAHAKRKGKDKGSKRDCYISETVCDSVPLAATLKQANHIVDLSQVDYDNLDCACAAYCKIVKMSYWTNNVSKSGKRSTCSCGKKLGKLKEKERWATGSTTLKAWTKLVLKGNKVVQNLPLDDCAFDEPVVTEAVVGGDALVPGNTEAVAVLDGWKAQCLEWGEDNWCMQPVVMVASESCTRYENADSWHGLVYANGSEKRNCPIFCWIATLGQEWNNDHTAEMEDCGRNLLMPRVQGFRAYSWSGEEMCEAGSAAISHHGDGERNEWERFETMRLGLNYGKSYGLQLRCEAWKTN